MSSVVRSTESRVEKRKLGNGKLFNYLSIQQFNYSDSYCITGGKKRLI